LIEMTGTFFRRLVEMEKSLGFVKKAGFSGPVELLLASRIQKCELEVGALSWTF